MSKATVLSFSLLFALAGTVSAQAGKFEPYGRSGIYNAAYNPGIAALQAPQAGKKLTIAFTGQAMTGTPMAYLLLGTSNRTWAGLALPLALPVVSNNQFTVAPGSQLLVAPEVVWGPSVWYMHLETTLDIPADPALVGLSFYCQWLVVSPTYGPPYNGSFVQTSCGAYALIGR